MLEGIKWYKLIINLIWILNHYGSVSIKLSISIYRKKKTEDKMNWISKLK